MKETTTIDIANKVICLDDTDIITLTDYCTEPELNNIKREFYDWYLKRNEYLIDSGCIILKSTLKMKGNNPYLYCTFDLTDPDEALFSILDNYDMKKIASFYFYREDNLTFKDIKLDILFCNHNLIHKQGSMLIPSDFKAKLNNHHTHKDRIAKNTKSEKFIRAYKNELLKEYDRLSDLAAMTGFIQILYASLYYFSNRDNVTIKESQVTIAKEVNTEKVEGIYEYNGFIDLSKNTIKYTPVIKKDPNEPVRDYERHIGSWIVRGHYRRINDKLVWIDQHVRGEGELEQRIYGSSNEMEKQLETKKFPVSYSHKISEIVNPNKPKPVSKKQDELNFFVMFKMLLHNIVRLFYKK